MWYHEGNGVKTEESQWVERIYPGKTDPTTYQHHASRYQFARRFVANKKVLDMACGSGYGSKLMYDGGALEVQGCDLSQEAIDFANKNYSNDSIKFQTMDASKISFPDNSFDCVVSFETIEHVSNYKNVIKEFHRVLKNDAVLIISTPNKETIPKGKDKPLNPFHIKEFTKDEFLDLMNEYFTDVEIFSQLLHVDLGMQKKIIKKIILALISLDVLKFRKRLGKQSVYAITDYMSEVYGDFTPIPYQISHKPFILIFKGKKRLV